MDLNIFAVLLPLRKILEVTAEYVQPRKKTIYFWL